MTIRVIGEVDFTVDDPSYSIDFAVSNPAPIEFSVDSGGGGGTYHPALKGRDLPDQHPIGAITDLTQELDSRPSEAIPDAYIDALR